MAELAEQTNQQEQATQGREGEALLEAHHVLRVLEGLVAGPFLMGQDLTLADLWAFPILAYLKLAPSGPELLADCPKLTDWFDRLAQRPAVLATRFPQELES